MSISLISFFFTFAFGIIGSMVFDCSIGIYLYQLIYFLNPSNRWWHTIQPIRYSFICAIVLLIVFLFKRNKYSSSRITDAAQIKWFAYMIFTMAIIAGYATWQEEHLYYLEIQLKTFLIFYLGYKVIDTIFKYKMMIWCHLIGCGYISYYAYFLGRDQSGRVENLGMSDGADANTTAAALITGIPFLFNFILNGNIAEKTLSTVICILVLNALILINSRGAFLGLIFGVLYFTVRSLKIWKYEKRKVLYLIAVLSLSLCAFLYLADNVFWERISSVFGENTQVESVSRSLFWMKSLELMKDNIFGLGARGFELLSPTIMPEEWLEPGFGMRAIHSTFFQALSDFGIFGIPLLMGLFGSNYNTLNKTYKYCLVPIKSHSYFDCVSLATAFYSYLVASLFINRLYSEMLYWIMLFIAIYWSMCSKKNNDEKV
jgi:hypothetical protein